MRTWAMVLAALALGAGVARADAQEQAARLKQAAIDAAIGRAQTSLKAQWGEGGELVEATKQVSVGAIDGAADETVSAVKTMLAQAGGIELLLFDDAAELKDIIKTIGRIKDADEGQYLNSVEDLKKKAKELQVQAPDALLQGAVETDAVRVKNGFFDIETAARVRLSLEMVSLLDGRVGSVVWRDTVDGEAQETVRKDAAAILRDNWAIAGIVVLVVLLLMARGLRPGRGVNTRG